MIEHYYGILFAITASILWSITVTIVKPITKNISPFLINPIKNSIGLTLFSISFLIFNIPFWYNHLYSHEYAIILISGSLGMVLGDTIFIYALNKIGANRVAIVDAFSPIVIYSYSLLLLPNQSLYFFQIIGFCITIIGLLILTYEYDYVDINFKVKRSGILLVLIAMGCTGFGVVYLKTVLNRVHQSGFEGIKLNLWITAFRLIPGVISNETSALTDSFQDNLLAPPIYTRPSDYKGWKVPEVLLSGNEKIITEWREREAIKRTEEKRPDLFE